MDQQRFGIRYDLPNCLLLYYPRWALRHYSGFVVSSKEFREVTTTTMWELDFSVGFVGQLLPCRVNLCESRRNGHAHAKRPEAAAGFQSSIFCPRRRWRDQRIFKKSTWLSKRKPGRSFVVKEYWNWQASTEKKKEEKTSKGSPLTERLSMTQDRYILTKA